MARKRSNELGELRRTAVVSTFGPGAIVDFRAGDAPVSAVVAGLEEWDRRAGPPGIANPQTVFEPRLQKQLGVAGFRLPPVFPEDDQESLSKALVAVRFPDWLQCPECQTLKPSGKWQRDPGRAYRRCGVCTAKSPGGRPVYAVPVRFICACERGHLQDFPWHFWVNHRDECERRFEAELRLRSLGAGLAGLLLSCKSCNSSRSMDGVFSDKALEALSCKGRRPWLADSPQNCQSGLRTLQRGASNLYFPVIRSALDIPPWSEAIQKTLGQFWHPITQMPKQDDRESFLRRIYSTLGLRMSLEQVVRQVEGRLRILEEAGGDDLRWDEYLQFTADIPTPPTDDGEFEIRPGTVPDAVSDLLGHLIRVVRLREVRAISGFTRIHPPDSTREDNDRTAAIQIGRLNWLPAVEVRGEGIFIGLSTEALHRWEAGEEVTRRAENVNRRFRESWVARYGADTEPPRQITPRFLLIHTLAHVLMKELALECGYSSASLRERIYSATGAKEMGGVLIYTASPDSDGTLGGLVRQGRPQRMQALLLQALRAARWCSSDPLCIGGLTSASEALNLAACHSCVLVSETSCEEYNRFLDRALLVDEEFGYFSRLI